MKATKLSGSMIDATFCVVDDDDSGQLSSNEIETAFFGARTRSKRQIMKDKVKDKVERQGRKTKSKRQIMRDSDWISKHLEDRIEQTCSEFVPALSLQV